MSDGPDRHSIFAIHPLRRHQSCRRHRSNFRTGLTGTHGSARPGDGGEFRDLHPYASGDRLRRIGWKATARRSQGFGDLYVRRTDATSDATLILVIEAAAATLVPNLVPAWWLLLVLSLSQLWREPSVTDFVYYLLLAGVHLLYVLGGLTRLLPWAGRMQVVACVRLLQRFVLVQAAAQAVAVGALLTFGGGRGTVPGLSILAAVLLGIVAAVLARGLRQAQASG